jgi:hypothetical protein
VVSSVLGNEPALDLAVFPRDVRMRAQVVAKPDVRLLLGAAMLVGKPMRCGVGIRQVLL